MENNLTTDFSQKTSSVCKYKAKLNCATDISLINGNDELGNDFQKDIE
jgi:hypothetical protein